MIEKPCCGNCTKYCDSYQYSGEIGRREMSLQTSTYGCVTHPDTREYLMQDVIEVLESKYRHYIENGFSVRANELQDVIALIQDGVKK